MSTKPGGSTRRRGAAARKPAKGSVRDVTGVIGRRQRRRWVRRALAITAAVVAVALVVGGFWLVRFSPYLALRDVEVVGATTLSPDAVREAAQAPLGTPLARVDTRAIDARVAQLVEVKQARVEKRYPHTVRITLTERSLVYALQTPGGLRYVDAQGVDYLAAPATLPPGTMTAELPPQPSQALRADVATVVAGLPPALKGGKVTAQTRDSITVVLPDGRQVFWGGADQTPLKAQVAVDLTTSVQANVYDVSAPGRPVTR